MLRGGDNDGRIDRRFHEFGLIWVFWVGAAKCVDATQTDCLPGIPLGDVVYPMISILTNVIYNASSLHPVCLSSVST